MIARPATRTRNCRVLPSRTRTEPVAQPSNRYIKRIHSDYTRQCYIASESAYNLATPGDDAGRCLLRPSARGSLRHAQAGKRVARKTGFPKPGDVKPWLEQQDAYTLHRPVRKRFPRKPCSVDKIMDVWEFDLVDVQALSRHNDVIKYLLTVIDVFSKFLHMVPLKSKSGKVVSAAFQSVLKDPRYLKPFKRRPVWVRTDKWKEFLNASFQKVLKRKGIQIQVCRNPDIKCSIVERVQRTVRDKLYKYFTHKNTYRYVDVLSEFVAGYNATGHGSTGMAPANVTDCDILALWKRMQKKPVKVRVKIARYTVGQHVGISKEKAKFAKSAEKISVRRSFEL